MTDRQKAQAAIRELKTTWYGYRVRPHSPTWNKAMALLESIGQIAPTPEPQPPKPEPPPPKVAPRTYNTSAGGNARFCVDGLDQDAIGYVDAYAHYDSDGRSLGGRDDYRMVPGIKPSNEMDGRSPCQGYTHNWRSFPPWPAESYLR